MSITARIKATEIIECLIDREWKRSQTKGQICVDWCGFESLLRYIIKQEDLDAKLRLVFINEALAAYTLRGKENI